MDFLCSPSQENSMEILAEDSSAGTGGAALVSIGSLSDGF